MSATVFGFGEAMIRFAPLEGKDHGDRTLYKPTPFLRSVGGDELNVCVALALLDHDASWISVLPEGPLGDVVLECGEKAGVNMSHVLKVKGDSVPSHVGVFTVLPEERCVHYQRGHSAFALHDLSEFGYLEKTVFSNRSKDSWIHLTGITPMISDNTQKSWKGFIETSIRLGLKIFFDFNHRRQLGSLDQLWSLVKPYLQEIEMIVISSTSLIELVQLEKLDLDTNALDDIQHEHWDDCLQAFRKAFGIKKLGCCFKSRDEQTGEQTRWSMIVDEVGLHSTKHIPVYHIPKDECGGGSAWAAACMDAFINQGDSIPLVQVARRADVLAALCQETVGDHSTVTRHRFESMLKKYDGKSCSLLDEKKTRIKETSALIRKAGVIAILRAGNTPMAIQRGKELLELGCRVIEITLDSPGWQSVLRTLAPLCQQRGAIIGVGTVMDEDVKHLELASSLGARFALSPIDPIGFIEACHDLGLVAGPSGFTSNECWRLHKAGADYVKLFHAGLVGPSILKSIRSVGTLREINFLPSGGVSPSNAKEWWDAGAATIGMGSNLVGADIKFEISDNSTQAEAARKQWEEEGKQKAKSLFERATTRC